MNDIFLDCPNRTEALIVEFTLKMIAKLLDKERKGNLATDEVDSSRGIFQHAKICRGTAVLTHWQL